MTPRELVDLDLDPHCSGARQDRYLRAAAQPRGARRGRRAQVAVLVLAALGCALLAVGTQRALGPADGTRAGPGRLRAAAVARAGEGTVAPTAGRADGAGAGRSTLAAAPEAGLAQAAVLRPVAPVSARRTHGAVARPNRDVMARYEKYLAAGHRCFDRGASRAAVRWYRKAARLVPGDDRAWWALGRAYHDRGENRKAKRYLEKALRLNGTSAMAMLVLGSVYQDEKNVAAAASAYADYLATAPEGAFSREASVLERRLRDRALGLEAAVRVGPTLARSDPF